MNMLVDNDNSVGAHHQGVRLPVLLLQFLEEHMRSMGASQTQQAANQRQRREVGRLLGAMRGPDFQPPGEHNQAQEHKHKQAQIPKHGCVRRGPPQLWPCIPANSCEGRCTVDTGNPLLCIYVNARALTLTTEDRPKLNKIRASSH